MKVYALSYLRWMLAIVVAVGILVEQPQAYYQRKAFSQLHTIGLAPPSWIRTHVNALSMETLLTPYSNHVLQQHPNKEGDHGGPSRYIPHSDQSEYKIRLVKPLLQCLKALGLLSIATTAAANAMEGSLDATAYQKALFNAPSDDFWYPPFLIGKWNTSLIFNGARFATGIPLEEASKNDRLPGFSRYSVFFVPEMGKDVIDVERRYVQLDSHPRDDHPFNIRRMVSAFVPDAVIDSAPYSFQKAPDWFHSPANRWNIRFHDQEGEGEVQLLTRKRAIRVFAGTVETVEFFKQVIVVSVFIAVKGFCVCRFTSYRHNQFMYRHNQFMYRHNQFMYRHFHEST